MPLLFTKQLHPHTLLGVWSITESPEELLQHLPDYIDHSAIPVFPHPKRQKEWLASRVLVYQLLQHFTSEPLQLLRSENGKPEFASSGIHVSISHTTDLAAVILSDTYEVGIDVEYISSKVLRVANRVLTEEELLYTSGDTEKTCLYWSAKETLYKLYSRRNLIFKENLLVLPPNAANHHKLQGYVQTDNLTKLYHIQHETVLSHILTYGIDSF
ncbi:4'-phosphopantetheinyl transferase family protein [Pontibacter sp. SGAir0037]|uniref:4'-phosphopantetheinyl transferase family protein n=1 Tax=Pontibacter sp. SGAir0037 TaxID=2571030 RepID=UPI0010CCDB95|nr:4'-phosphopantetheinyl transferase family protein [Pontibacter sp. SGAir0037]QCR24583.1 4-phosphopantetheinyl transferase [Pontibacter sp. SGAir0037]